MTEPEIRDFTLPMKPKQFRIDEDLFKAPAILSAVALKRAANLHAQLGDIDLSKDVEAMLGLVADIFDIFLPGASGRRFRARLLTEGRDADPDGDPPRLEPDPPPIDLVRQALPALYFLLEAYGLRPTEPSSPSPAGSTDGPTDTPNDGTSSTDGATPTE
jgi:hypothetical protein